jgi:cation transport ATPase
VRALAADGHHVIMVGDGTNDAAALSAASVGVALAGGGSGITAEAADVVLLGGTLEALPAALAISRRSLRIARQSILVGLGCSAVAMVFAALGRIAPTAGAVLQELIDVAVILNALRASREPAPTGPTAGRDRAAVGADGATTGATRTVPAVPPQARCA